MNLEQLVHTRVAARLDEMNGTVQRIISEEIDRQVAELVNAILETRANGKPLAAANRQNERCTR